MTAANPQQCLADDQGPSSPGSLRTSAMLQLSPTHRPCLVYRENVRFCHVPWTWARALRDGCLCPISPWPSPDDSALNEG